MPHATDANAQKPQWVKDARAIYAYLEPLAIAAHHMAIDPARYRKPGTNPIAYHQTATRLNATVARLELFMSVASSPDNGLTYLSSANEPGCKDLHLMAQFTPEAFAEMKTDMQTLLHQSLPNAHLVNDSVLTAKLDGLAEKMIEFNARPEIVQFAAELAECQKRNGRSAA